MTQMPTRKAEEWRYADLAALEQLWPLAEAEQITVPAGGTFARSILNTGGVIRIALTIEAKASATVHVLTPMSDVDQAELLARAVALMGAVAPEAAAATHYRRLIATADQKRIMAIVMRLAPQYGVHPGLAYAVIRAESNFNPLAVSEKNAQGLMQLIPETAARFNVTQPLDPEQNIRGGLAYLRWLLAYFKGEGALVVAAYNAGEGAVDRYQGVPPFPETQGYVRRIQEVFNLQRHPFDARVTAPSPEWPRIAARPRS